MIPEDKKERITKWVIKNKWILAWVLVIILLYFTTACTIKEDYNYATAAGYTTHTNRQLHEELPEQKSRNDIAISRAINKATKPLQ